LGAGLHAHLNLGPFHLDLWAVSPTLTPMTMEGDAMASGSSRPIERRLLLQSAALGIGVIGGLAPVVAAIRKPGGGEVAGPLPAPSVTDPNDPRLKKFSMTDSFYTLDNDYFQGWAKGSAEAAAVLLMQRDQQVDNSNVDTLKSVFETAKSKGVQGISTLPNTAAVSKDLMGIAQRDKFFVSSNWSNAAWSTPLDIGEYFYSFQTGNDEAGAREVCKVLFQAMGGSGKFIHIEGIKGNSASDNRTAGVDAALKEFPNIEMVARQQGGFSRGGTEPVIESLLTANTDVTGIMCQNDDSAMAAINAVQARGMKDVKIVGIDAIKEFLEAVKRGAALASWAHHGAFIGAFSTVRIFDALAGVKLTAPERMMYFGGFIIDTAEAAGAYQDLMFNPSKRLPFDYERMSRALHPDDWDPQNNMAPMDLDQYWARDPKPAGYDVPKAYSEAKDDGQFEKIQQQYKAAFRNDPFEAVRKLCRTGGQDILS